jgi:hypothetical protein
MRIEYNILKLLVGILFTLVQSIPVGRFNQEYICLLRSLRIPDNRLIPRSDIPGKDNLGRLAPLFNP